MAFAPPSAKIVGFFISAVLSALNFSNDKLHQNDIKCR
jgi:hypothetical protein